MKPRDSKHSLLSPVTVAAVFCALSFWGHVWADEPLATSSDADQDIPKVSQPANQSGRSAGKGQSQTNFGRFVKKSKAEFDADPKLKAEFKNYGQYVSSLRRHHGDDDHNKRPESDDGNPRGGSSGSHHRGSGGSLLGN